MFRATRIGVASLLVALGSPFHTTAQPARSESDPPIVPTLAVYAMPGFKYRAPGLGAGAVIPLREGQPFSATFQSDAHSRCSHSLQMPAREITAFDATASAVWKVEAAPVSVHGEEATVDIRWSRRVPRAGVLLEDSLERTQRLTLRDGARGILDAVHAAGDAPGVCESFGLAVELRFRSPEDVDDAGLAFDLWLIDRGSPRSIAPARVRTQARQGADANFGFPPMKLTSAAGDVTLAVGGVVTGRARKNGSIDLTFDTEQSAGDARGWRSDGGGRKRLVVRPDETIEFQLPETLKAKLPPDLRDHDFALRVTTERLW
jgi:hypothetical protein